MQLPAHLIDDAPPAAAFYLFAHGLHTPSNLYTVQNCLNRYYQNLDNRPMTESVRIMPTVRGNRIFARNYLLRKASHLIAPQSHSLRSIASELRKVTLDFQYKYLAWAKFGIPDNASDLERILFCAYSTNAGTPKTIQQYSNILA